MHPDGTIDALCTRLTTVHPSSPRLIWYGPDSERVELSGRVLENWVAKTANYLVDELDADTSTVVELDMDPHWRSLCWALACWRVGATLRLTPGSRQDTERPAEVTVTATPRAGQAGLVVAVALGALQMSWPGRLPDGVLDYAGEIRGFDDVFVADDSPDPGQVAVEGPTLPAVDYAALLGEFASVVDDGAVVLVESAAPMASVLASALGTWRASGTLVLVSGDTPIDESLLAAERVTTRP